MNRARASGHKGMSSEPTGEIDRRFSHPDAGPTPWSATMHVLEHAEMYWLSTVRRDGRPHVTPLMAVEHDGAMYFSTGFREQKYRNLESNDRLALTTGTNTFARGLDVVVEGRAVRVTDRETLERLADAYEEKYGSEWRMEVGDGAFGEGEMAAAALRIEPSKVMAFAKEPYAQTTYRL
jgi:nitroimidazol reductase NimA-like FMN-containing flavoprotein (pyridoxamine 5'-phosphate oxidase superfamily)